MATKLIEGALAIGSFFTASIGASTRSYDPLYPTRYYDPFDPFYTGGIWTSRGRLPVPVLPGAVGSSSSGSGVFDVESGQIPSVLPGPMVGGGIQVFGTGYESTTSSYQREGEMAIDWGGLIGSVANTYIGARYAPSPVVMPSFVPATQPYPTVGTPQATVNVGGPSGISVDTGSGGGKMAANGECGTGCDAPRYLLYDCKTGEFKPRRRRRRRRLLTNQDIADLNSVAALAGKGAALSAAIAQATRR